MGAARELLVGLVSLALVFTAAGVIPPPRPALSPAASPPPRELPSAPRGVGRDKPSPALRVLMADGSVETMDLEDYVLGVVWTEMPASFQPEALKAQAVCARTYALSRARAGTHAPQADVCASSGCCQGYAPQPPESWGADTQRYTEKLRAAVDATAGEVLEQDGQVINAVFHASSSGRTASAQAVWGTAVPYLVSVPTPETAQAVPRLESQVTCTPQEFQALFLEKYPAAKLSGAVESWFSQPEREDWGGVSRITVGGVTLSGGEMRALLGLRSARFDVETGQDKITFHVTGYGHGVGMSQYGANLLARDGQDYREILTHYYPGTELGRVGAVGG